MSNARNQPNYSNSLFFKYTLPRGDEGSVHARSTIIERVIGIRVRESIILNPNLNPGIAGKKRITLDVHVKDGRNRHLNIEIQTVCKGTVEMMRFRFYGIRALNSQPKGGKFYDQLKLVYRIISIDEYAQNNRNLISRHQMHNEQGEDENGYPFILYIFVHMPVINDIVKEKETWRLNGFEQLMYLLENNGRNNMLKSKERPMRVFVNKYEKMQKDDELWSAAMAIQVGEACYRNGPCDSFDEGKAAGETEGKRQPLRRQIQIKFHEDCVTWLQVLAKEQMQIVPTLLLERDTFESLRK